MRERQPDDPGPESVEIPEEIRAALADLSADEIGFLVTFTRTAISFGRAGKLIALVIGALAGMTIGIPMLIDALARIASWVPKSHP